MSGPARRSGRVLLFRASGGGTGALTLPEGVTGDEAVRIAGLVASVMSAKELAHSEWVVAEGGLMRSWPEEWS